MAKWLGRRFLARLCASGAPCGARSQRRGRTASQQAVDALSYLTADVGVLRQIDAEDLAQGQEAIRERQRLPTCARGNLLEARRQRVVHVVGPTLLVTAQAIADPAGDSEAQAVDRAAVPDDMRCFSAAAI